MCFSCRRRGPGSYSDHDAQECSIAGTDRNDSGNRSSNQLSYRTGQIDERESPHARLVMPFSLFSLRSDDRDGAMRNRLSLY